jgi:hypothetical protein
MLATRDHTGRVTRLLKVAQGEQTCTGCGEIAIDGFCPRCGLFDDGTRRKEPPPLVPTISYLRDGEYYVMAA